jgi:hypothetical protein
MDVVKMGEGKGTWWALNLLSPKLSACGKKPWLLNTAILGDTLSWRYEMHKKKYHLQLRPASKVCISLESPLNKLHFDTKRTKYEEVMLIIALQGKPTL